MLTLNSYNNVIEDINSKKKTVAVHGIVDNAIGHFSYSLSQHLDKNNLIITYEESRAKAIYEDIKNLYEKDVYYFPKREVLYYDRLAESYELNDSRVETLYNALNNKSNTIIVTTIDAVMDKVINREIFEANTIHIDTKMSIDLKELANRFIRAGYERVSLVEGKGQFSIRGGIVDFFAPNYSMPHRIELFDIEVDSIREFDPDTQKSVEMVEEVYIPPAKDILLQKEYSKDIIKGISDGLSKSKLDSKEAVSRLNAKFERYIEQLDEMAYIQNRDLIIPFIPEDRMSSLLDYLDRKSSFIIIDEPKRIEELVQSEKLERMERVADLIEKGEILPKNEETQYDFSRVLEIMNPFSKITLSNILKDNKHFKPSSIISFNMKTGSNYSGKLNLLKEELEHFQYRGYKVLIFAGSAERRDKLYDTLINLEIPVEKVENLDATLKSGQVLISDKGIHRGFEYSDIKFVVINHREIFGRTSKKKKDKKKKKSDLNFADLKIGDYVVHESHGIGQYKGTRQLEVQGIKRDYLLIQYKGEDRLFIPTDQLNMIHKYIGDGGVKPRTNKLNSTEWKKTKSKAKSAVEDMAEDLIKLYGTRETVKGYQFSPDTDWQFQFEDSFQFEETQGQIDSINEIKSDMESDKPMDRLLCADVGYGKTEVAIRAAFKAVMDGKQVAFLVPTTLLAQQHYNTIIQRFRDFPIEIVVLSRFKSKAEIKADIDRIRKGLVDIVVGTHRILSKDLQFKDLGLLIIDEEQRFGVKHKETLKLLKENVDTLTLTATPIPRTLQMSMIGIRDMSVIEEPPEDRYPIQTYVVEYNEMMIRDAILKEISRGGQVYFVYNRVDGIINMSQKLKELVPEAEFAVAHGQMSETELEGTMLNFLEGDIDVLVCTTIIETGIDIPNVNTIIINDADKLGLSQLYQLRGRVGRTNRLAYGYFMYQRDKVLTEIAEKRLMTIKEFTEFGSGYKIAIRDLEIRGAGNILGQKQSGHIEAIGYDLYMKYLGTAIKKYKGEKVVETVDTLIDITIDAFISESYIPDAEQRLDIYKKISVIENEDDYEELVDEIIDRYSDMPEEVNNLLDISLIKQMSTKRHIKSIIGNLNEIKIEMQEDYKLNFEIFNELKEVYGNSVDFILSNPNGIIYRPKKYPLHSLKELVEMINENSFYN
ncbi:MAG: transcription-repair coupling factor [Tissierellia bacterium]|nr:transcription-repair coupling factor [Tissierellia bacterium]